MFDIRDAVLRFDVERVKVIMEFQPLRTVFGLLNYTSSNDEPITAIGHIKENRYNVSDGYKVEIVPDDPSLSRESFYQMDFNSMVRRGHAKVLIDISNIDLNKKNWRIQDNSKM